VKTETRHALKQDKLALAAKGGVSWVTENRSSVIRSVIWGGLALVLIVGSFVFWSVETSAADNAIGAAVDTYSAPLNAPGAPPEPGAFANAADRLKAANQQFQSAVQKYGWLPQGARARYFAGVTDMEMGQTGSAETELKAAAGTGNRNTANLAKLALAQLYHQTGRDPQAISIYNDLIAHPSVTVSTATAQLDLADLYVSENKQDQARLLWAKVKDADKDGMAGSIASQKLSGKQQ
jgi:predicted negative regulator of RcsB-dependent stress response